MHGGMIHRQVSRLSLWIIEEGGGGGKNIFFLLSYFEIHFVKIDRKMC